MIAPSLRAILENQKRIVLAQVPSPNSLADVRNAIRFQLLNWVEAHTEIVASTLVRTTKSMQSAIERVQRSLQCAIERAGEELVAAEIRGALDELGLVTGAVYTDDILEVVFSRFCIGK
jgi:tRNA U34 5-carboxymethylaminomethyl modifying GTPase MnmE/TrmE